MVLIHFSMLTNIEIVFIINLIQGETSMKKTFLKLLADSRLDRESKPVDLDYTELYRLSRMHQVTALVYNQIYKFNGISEELKEQWKKDTLKINAIQTIKTKK